MYPLLSWKLISILVGIVVASALFIDDLGHLIGISVSDGIIIRGLPIILLGLFGAFFGPTRYWAPWRILWRIWPGLNKYFPDLNGIWVGTTNSNWPTIDALTTAAKSKRKITEQDLQDIDEQEDAIAMQITNSLFALNVKAGLSSTDGISNSITAKPWRHQHTQCVHLSYVYEQLTTKPSHTDEEKHLGAADLSITSNDNTNADGTYWTRRSWITGRNTAGRLSMKRISEFTDSKKTLRDFALEYHDTPNVKSSSI